MEAVEQTTKKDAVDLLSPAEFVVLRAMWYHGRAQLAADELKLSVQTVRSYLRSIHEKLGVSSTQAAICACMPALLAGGRDDVRVVPSSESNA